MCERERGGGERLTRGEEYGLGFSQRGRERAGRQRRGRWDVIWEAVPVHILEGMVLSTGKPSTVPSRSIVHSTVQILSWQ